jgi:hypothetical protein
MAFLLRPNSPVAAVFIIHGQSLLTSILEVKGKIVYVKYAMVDRGLRTLMKIDTK